MSDAHDAAHWVKGPAFVCYGARIRIQASTPRALKGIDERLPVPRRPTTAPADYIYSLVAEGDRFGLLRGEKRLLAKRSLRTVHRFLESDIHTSVSRGARRKLFVHAGVVGWRGHAIVIPGRSLTGKSSLVAALVRAGADYYSDEFAVMDRQGRVHPYPKPISLRRRNGKPPRSRTAADLGGQTGINPLPLGLVVVTAYRAHADWDPAPISAADGVMHLLDNTVLAQIRPRFALSVLTHAVDGCGAVEGERPKAASTAASILELLDKTLKGRT